MATEPPTTLFFVRVVSTVVVVVALPAAGDSRGYRWEERETEGQRKQERKEKKRE